MSIRPEPIYIVTATLQQAKATAIDRGMNPSPWSREWAWVYDASVLRGWRQPKVILSFGHRERVDWPELEEWLAAVEAEYVE